MAVVRVAKRVSEGGHNIPIETIHRRYWLGLRNFFNIFIPIVDSWMFFDNKNRPHLIANNNAIMDLEQFSKIKELCQNKKKIRLFDKISNGLKQSYETLLKRKAALGQDMVIADASGQPVVVPAADLLAKREEKIRETDRK